MQEATKEAVKVTRGPMAAINKVLDTIIDGFGHIAELLMVFIMVIVTSEIVLRYFFGYSLIWTIEVTEYCLLWITFLATAWVLKLEGHVMVDLIPNMLKPRGKAILYMVLSIICTLICVVYAWFGATVTLDLFQKGRVLSTVMRPPAYILFMIIPIGNILLILQFIRRTHGLYLKVKETAK
jgi:C4-dicarboxylate transporter DctQ subunit